MIKKLLARTAACVFTVCLLLACGLSAGADNTAPDESVQRALASCVMNDCESMLEYGHIGIDIPSEELLRVFEEGEYVTVSLNGYGSYTVPVCTSYDSVDAGKMLLRAAPGKEYVELAVNYGQIAVQCGLAEEASGNAEGAYAVKSGVSFPIEAAITEPVTSFTAYVVEDDPDLLRYGNIVIGIPADDLLASLNYGDTVTVDLGVYGTYTVPFLGAFEDVTYGDMLLWAPRGRDRVSLAIYNGPIALQAGIIRNAAENDEMPYELKDDVPFPIKAVIELSDRNVVAIGENPIGALIRSDDRSDYPELSDAAFANMRPVLTKGMGEGKLYRSSSPVCPEIGRNEYADKAAAAAGIKTFINLADTESVALSYPGYADSYYQKQQHIFLALPIAFGSESFRNGLAAGYRFMTVHEAPYLIHCIEGKDRAGLTVAILECLLGADYDEVVEDYTETYRNYYSVENGVQRQLTETETEAIGKVIINNLGNLFGLRIDRETDLADAAYRYLLDVGLSEEEIAALKSVLAD